MLLESGRHLESWSPVATVMARELIACELLLPLLILPNLPIERQAVSELVWAIPGMLWLAPQPTQPLAEIYLTGRHFHIAHSLLL